MTSIFLFPKFGTYHEQDNVWGSILIHCMGFFNCTDPIITDKKSEAKTLLIGEYAILSGFQVYHAVM